MRNKLIFGFVFISLFVLLNSYISFRTLIKVENSFVQISTKFLPLVQNLENMRYNGLRLIASSSEIGYLISESSNLAVESAIEDENELIQQSCNLCHAAFSQYEEMVNESFPDFLLPLDEIRDGGMILHISAIEFVDAKRKGIIGIEALEKKENMEIGEMEFLNSIERTLKHANDLVTEEKTHLASIISSTIKNIFIISGLAFIISVLIGILISRSLTRPITKLIQWTDNFRKGNIAETIDIKSNDEIGLLGKSYNEMGTRVKLLISQLEQEVEHTKQAEELLKQSGNQRELILEVAGEGIIGLDLDGNHTFINPKACDILGYKVEELIGKNSHSVFHHSYRDGTDYPDIKCPIYETLKDGKDHFGEEYFWNKGGGCVPIRYSSSPMIEHEQITGAVITFRDISEQKESDKLKSSLYEISQAVHKSPDLDSLYKIIHEIVKGLMLANNFYIALYDPDTDLISFPYFIDEVDEDSTPIKSGRSCSAYVLRTGEPAIIDMELMNELNSTGEIDVIGSPSDVWLGVPLKVNNKTIGVMVVQDYKDEHSYGEKEQEILMFVSEQVAYAIYKKSTEAELKKYTAEMVQLNAEKDKFFSIIAHDLKSPFNSIIGFSDLLVEHVGKKDYDRIEKYAEIIHKSSNIAMDLLMNLMEWSQSQTGRLEFNPEYFELGELIKDTELLLGTAVEQKSISLTNNVPSYAPVFADKKMISTVLRNLISNAIKFTYPDGEIIISTKKNQGKLTVSVSDNGVGIPKAYIKKIFRIDENYTTSGTNEEKGTGLGLILCKEFIKKHGGEIWVESEEGIGTTFYFTLPNVVK